MFQTAKDAIEYIELTRRRKYNLDAMFKMLEKYNNFHHSLKLVHIGGTNGKGSSVHFLSSILINSGYKVGTFTSPYLISHHDRIRINNVYISDDDLLNIINLFYNDFEEFQLSFFEMDTFIALYYFYIYKVDIAIIEVGLGGRLDATNVINPLVSAVTNIGFDHMDYLGNTLEKIAFEKAGIIKEKTPFITTETKDECLNVFKKVCLDKEAEFIKVNEPANVKINEDSTVFEIDNQIYQIQGTAVYQPKNAALAIALANRLSLIGFNKINDITIKEGINKSFWFGRFERLSNKPLIYIDGAHNVPAVKILTETLNLYKEKGYKIRIIFSSLKDKDYKSMLELLKGVSDDITITEFETVKFRFASASELAKGFDVKVEVDYKKLYDETYYIKEDKVLTIFVGSLYFISLVRAYHFATRG
ncbi:TPA: bifunctional folylpolyglutamate synthase/dihydrofolate synthase [bacterium]|nr:bifunctional folylpolyglutamate synthase/dihydrofolate synthase [bacterium]